MFKNRVRSKRKMIVIAVLALMLFSSTGSTFAQGPGGDGTPPIPPSDGGQPPDGGPGGQPPAGEPGSQAPGGDGSTATNPVLTATCGVYTLDGEEGEATTGQTYTSTEGDVSDICVINGGTLTLVNPTIIKSGDTSSAYSSSFYGLNAAILVGSGSVVTISGGTVTTDGEGASFGTTDVCLARTASQPGRGPTPPVLSGMVELQYPVRLIREARAIQAP